MQLLTTEADFVADGGTGRLLPSEGRGAGSDKECGVVEITTGVANEAVGTCVLVTTTSGNNSDRLKPVRAAVPDCTIRRVLGSRWYAAEREGLNEPV